MKGTPPISMRSGGEKNVMPSGERSTVDTLVRRSSSTQGIPACFAATPTASPQGPAPMTSSSTASTSIAILFVSYLFLLPHFPRLLNLDDLIPPGSHTDIAHRNPREILQTVQIGARSSGKIGQLSSCAGRALPTWVGLVDRLYPSERVHLSRHLLAQFASQPVHGSDRDFGEGIEHVELGHRQPGESVGPGGVTHHGGVEPAAAPWPPSYRSKFSSQLP